MQSYSFFNRHESVDSVRTHPHINFSSSLRFHFSATRNCLSQSSMHTCNVRDFYYSTNSVIQMFSSVFLLYCKSKAKFKFRNAQGITSLRNKHSVNSSLVYKWSILFFVIQWVVLWTQSLPEVPSEHWYHQPPVWTQWGPVWCSIPRSWPWLWLAHFCKVIHENSTHACYNSKVPIAKHLDCKTFTQLYFADLIATLQHIYQGCDYLNKLR